MISCVKNRFKSFHAFWIWDMHFSRFFALPLCLLHLQRKTVRSCPAAGSYRHPAGLRLLRPHGKRARPWLYTVWSRPATGGKIELDSLQHFKKLIQEFLFDKTRQSQVLASVTWQFQVLAGITWKFLVFVVIIPIIQGNNRICRESSRLMSARSCFSHFLALMPISPASMHDTPPEGRSDGMLARFVAAGKHHTRIHTCIFCIKHTLLN